MICILGCVAIKVAAFFMVIRISIWFAWNLLQLPIKITITCHIHELLTYFVIFWEKQVVNEVFYQKYMFKFSYLFRSFSAMGLAPVVGEPLPASATTLMKFWVGNLQLSFDLAINNTKIWTIQSDLLIRQDHSKYCF